MEKVKEILIGLVDVFLMNWGKVLCFFICSTILFFWFSSDIQLGNKIIGSLFPIVFMVFAFITRHDWDCAPGAVFGGYVIWFGLSALVFCLVAGESVKEETMKHHPRSIVRLDNSMLVVSNSGRVLTSKSIMYYMAKDSDICIVQIKNWNDFGSRISDTYTVDFCK